ncbi:phage tail protein [Acrocarpospora corrugata]|uniref:Phage tail protein n=1 Tax=Acrocarpospora corrugata TaxID=35763 RepID=A0A5M3W331_9ACTN|nr:phage tail protein [Acrocarpospora corrugata]GES03477.1 phage tail protein [Acrocarpospora corrugata]
MPPGQRVDPYRNFNFLVEIEGLAVGSFVECSGLGSTTEVIENPEGGVTTILKMPGRTSYSDITLKWGLTDSQVLWEWRQQIIDGNVVRKSGSVVVFDLAGSREVARWNFTGAWPSKWEGAAYSAKGNDIAIETLVLTLEKLSRV